MTDKICQKRKGDQYSEYAPGAATIPTNNDAQYSTLGRQPAF
jgi:hypothetical protein